MQKTARIRLLAGVAMAGLTSIITSGVSAQEASTALPEIVVTARRVTERLQDVPLAVTAVTPEVLREQNITRLQDIKTIAPSLTISPSSQGSTIPSVVLRGQRASRFVIGQDLTVGVYTNEFVQTRPAGLNSTLYDTASVQILNGPQGTLFGRNTTGGAIIVTHNKPTFEPSAELQVETGNFNRAAVTAVANMPFNDKLSFRFAGNVSKRDGFMKNIFTGQITNDEDNRSARLSMLWRPNDKIESLTVGDFFNSDTNGFLGHLAFITPNTVQGRIPASVASLARVTAANNIWVGEGEVTTFEKTRSGGVSNVTTVDINPNLTFKNVVGYRTVRGVVNTDNDGSSVMVIANMQTQAASWYSEEAQLLGRSDLVDWITGLYYYHEWGTDFSRGRNNSINIGYNGGTGRNISYAAFAQTTFKLDSWMQGLSLVLAGRYTWDQRQITAKRNLFNPTTGITTCEVRGPDNVPLPIALCGRVARVKFNEPTYNVSLNWKATPDTLLYVAHRRGYRSGGVNVRAVNVPDFTPFRPEIVRDLEFGLKSDFRLGGVSMRTNLAAYHQWYNDIQRNQTILGTSVTGQVIQSTTVFNAAKAQLSGFEAQLSARLAPGVDITSTYSYIHAGYDEYVNPADGRDLSDNKFPETPKHQFSLTGRYEVPVDEKVGRIAASLTFYTQSDIQVNDVNSRPYTDAAGYSFFNGNIDWQSFLGSKFDLNFYMRNIGNKQYILNGNSTADSTGYTIWLPGPPRMWGVQARYQF